MNFAGACIVLDMNIQILVAYASGSGSTREVAEAIAAKIEKQGLTTIIQNVSEVASITAYGGVVIGSSIRIGRWLPEAVACLERIKADVGERPVAYFTTCLTMVDDTKENRETVLDYMEPLLVKIAPEIKPIGLGLFAGSLDPGRQAIMVGDGPQGDYRNWEAIGAWAQEIGEQFAQHLSTDELVLEDAVLSYTDLSYSDLTQVNLQGAELHASQLTEANMEASHLQWADLSNSQMQGANLFRANLIGSIMTDSNLEKANLAEAILNGAILQNANLFEANLTRADLNWVDFSQADLRRANLQQARLGWAKLTNARLDEADLTDARYNEHTIWPDGFSPEEAGCINEGRGPV
jgi:menaquinone-dependent protoporphyrinogen oxidase